MLGKKKREKMLETFNYAYFEKQFGQIITLDL